MRKVIPYILEGIIVFIIGIFVGFVTLRIYIGNQYIYNDDFKFPQRSQAYNTPYIPDDGVVPDAGTAIKIAKAVWITIFGEEDLRWRIFHVQLIDNSVWLVRGVLVFRMYGGSPYIKIDKKTGAVLDITHTAQKQSSPIMSGLFRSRLDFNPDVSSYGPTGGKQSKWTISRKEGV